MVAAVLVIVVDDEELHGAIALPPAFKVVADVEVFPVERGVGCVGIAQRDALCEDQRIACSVFCQLTCGEQRGGVVDVDLPADDAVVALVAGKREEIGELGGHGHVGTARV